MNSRSEDVEELIIQGFGHRERRNILKIISARAIMFQNRNRS
jgi:hypothetical protein